MLVGYILARVCLRCSYFFWLPSLFSSQNVGVYALNWPVVVCLRWLYHHMLSVSQLYIYKYIYILIYNCDSWGLWL